MNPDAPGTIGRKPPRDENMNPIDRLTETLTQKMLKAQVSKLQKKLQKMTVQYQVATLNWTVPPDTGQSAQDFLIIGRERELNRPIARIYPGQDGKDVALSMNGNYVITTNPTLYSTLHRAVTNGELQYNLKTMQKLEWARGEEIDRENWKVSNQRRQEAAVRLAQEARILLANTRTGSPEEETADTGKTDIQQV